MTQSIRTIDSLGTKRWNNEKGQRHRLDGPAIEYFDGTKEWRINDKTHREDGPAIEYSNGDTEWFINGYRHRLDGPAVENIDGYTERWINGEYIPKKNFPIGVIQFLFNCDEETAKLIYDLLKVEI
jgi:hypothetical protein